MKQIELTTKLVLAIIGLTSVSAILVPTYAAPQIKSADIVNGEVKTEDLAPNAVTSPKIQDGQVNTADLANNAVTTGKISDGAVTTDDILDGTILKQDIKAGEISEAGVGTLQRTERHASSGNFAPLQISTAIVLCESGEIATGGGYITQTNVNIYGSYERLGSEEGWQVNGKNTSPTDEASMEVYVECLKLVP